MPERMEVDAGAAIVWDNRDTAPHTATAADDAQRASFDTKVVKEGAKSQAVTFDKPGEYAYICDLHPFMKGTVVVR
jgi:plastocyanin